jgi:hypothetical protein
MSSLQETLRQLLAFEGVRVVAVIDIATGMIVRSAGDQAGDQAGDFRAAAASMAGEAKMARAALGPSCPGGDLDEITMVTASRLHLSRTLDSSLGEGLLLFVELDRARANIALASLRVGQAALAALA